jgi:hypothetical protein
VQEYASRVSEPGAHDVLNKVTNRGTETLITVAKQRGAAVVAHVPIQLKCYDAILVDVVAVDVSPFPPSVMFFSQRLLGFVFI